MTPTSFGRSIALLALSGVTVIASAATAPSIPPVDAPELAALGPAQVGVRSVHLIDPQQYDVLGELLLEPR